MPALPLLTLTAVVLSFGLYPPVFAQTPTIRAGAHPLSDRRRHRPPIETLTIFTTTFEIDPPPPTTTFVPPPIFPSSFPASSEPLTTSSSQHVSSSRSSRSVSDTHPPALPASSSRSSAASSVSATSTIASLTIPSPMIPIPSQSPTLITSSSAPSGVAAASGVSSTHVSHRARTLAGIIVPILVVGIIFVWLACRYIRSRRTNNARVSSSFEGNDHEEGDAGSETSPSTSHSLFSLSKTSARRARMAGYTGWSPSLPPRALPLPLPPSPTSAYGSQVLLIGPESRSIAGSESEKHSSTGTWSSVLELVERDNNAHREEEPLNEHPFAEVQVQGRPSTSTSVMTTESRAPTFATVDPAAGGRDSTPPVPPTPPPHYSRLLPPYPDRAHACAFTDYFVYIL
ncbi:hypothetical protein C8F01DRAFT_1260809 [Mycena amicta]|nr:hypothetical protein C8F01DRAFT_1260809 [Mycena amicta]